MVFEVLKACSRESFRGLVASVLDDFLAGVSSEDVVDKHFTSEVCDELELKVGVVEAWHFDSH